MVLECVWEFFAKARWVGPTLEAFAAIGYGVVVRQEQAARYLPQEKLRGILIAVRSDWWGQARGQLGPLFTSASPLRVATLRATGLVGPDPHGDSPLYLTALEEELYTRFPH